MADSIRDLFFGTATRELIEAVDPQRSFDDVVLPERTLRALDHALALVRKHDLIFRQWGLAERHSSGLGLAFHFAGPPGTGKTMTAAVLARDLGLDLYRIDLSAVVSKYIGETEKNLDHIFVAARGSNAILFFDEADALFGKRSQVSDAHDRYANIEVAYLLQALEEHEGVVILASNARKHIDEAFARRLHYVVEYPQPDQALRERLWRGIYPPAVPLSDDVDLGFLARQFAISGGDIRNVALDAAFLAAVDGQVITMRHLVVAMARQSIKLGRIPSATDFRQYHAWITQDI
jgi:SpoVK/Ycf46/Vps4 family AAA+-type ATPase